MAGDSPFTRRAFLRAGGAASVLAGSALVVGQAGAEKPTGKTTDKLPAAKAGTGPTQPGRVPAKHAQAPGFFRFRLGRFEVTVVSDGNLQLPARAIAAKTPEAELRAFLKSRFLSTDTSYAHLNLCLINTGDNLVLVDAGSGDNFQPSAGKLVENLTFAGYKPEQINHVVLTHAHPDHLWGVTDDFEEAPRFPNATHYISKAEWSYWSDKQNEVKIPESQRAFAIAARRHFGDISGRLKRVAPEAEIVPGVRFLATPGHTPGHCSVVVESEKQKLIVTGDALTHVYASLEHPDWQPAFDIDPDLAVKTRLKLLDMAAGSEALVLGYHFAFPGLGQVSRRGRVYQWTPSLWQWQV